MYFFSLDAGNTLAVRAARMALNLPYYSASMVVTRRGDAIEYRSQREGMPTPPSTRSTVPPEPPPRRLKDHSNTF